MQGADNAQTADDDAHDGTAGERHVESIAKGVSGLERCAPVGLCRDTHADVAGQDRKPAANQESDASDQTVAEGEKRPYHNQDRKEQRILVGEERRGSPMDGKGDLENGRILERMADDGVREYRDNDEPEQCDKGNKCEGDKTRTDRRLRRNVHD